MMQSKDYGVRVIRAFEQRVVGQVFYPPGVLRDMLVQRGFVERVRGESGTEGEQAAEPVMPLRRRSTMKAR